jgi:hypothetical protein
MEARPLDQTFRDHEGDDLCLWLEGSDPTDDVDAALIQTASVVGFAAHVPASSAWSERLRALLSLPTIAP